MMKEILSIIILGLFLLIGILPGISANSTSNSVVKPLTFGRTITVDDDRVECPNADYTDLHEAVDVADWNQDITGIDVYPGEYLVDYSPGLFIYYDDLYIKGVGGALKTIVDGCGWATIEIYGKNIEISGLTIKSTDSLSWDGIVVGSSNDHSAENVKIHDCIFDLPISGYEEYTVYGLVLGSSCSNVEVYHNDFICDEENAIDYGGANHNWHNNFWEDWDGIWDEGIEGVPYERNGIFDSSPYWDPCVLSRPSDPVVVEKRISGKSYEYTIVSFDDDGDGLYYEVEWGDDHLEWNGYPEEGFLPQGEIVTAKHRFKAGQKHLVTVYVMDEHDQWNRVPTVLKLSRGRETGSLFFEKLLVKFPMLNNFLSLF